MIFRNTMQTKYLRPASNVNIGSWAQYGVLTIAFLCVSPVMGRLHLQHAGTWLILICFLVLSVAAAFDVLRRHLVSHVSGYAWLCAYYACLVAGIGLIHMTGLMGVPGDLTMNVQGISAEMSLKSEIAFTLYYSFFPVMILGQLAFLRRMSFQGMTRIVSMAVGISAGVAVYQRFVDSAFLHTGWWGQRYEGLATDPNALALTLFLALPVLAIGIRWEKSRTIRICYLLLLMLFILAEWATKNRTAAAGILLAFLCLPVLVSCSQRHWHWKARAALLASPIMLLGIICFCSPTITQQMNEIGGSARRLAQTWHTYETGGVLSVFTRGEARGHLYRQATELIMKSPLAGWGPNGFYREYSNLAYQQTGRRVDAFDSPLNHYLVIASDFGIPVMLLNLGLLLMPVFMGIIVFRRLEDAKSRFVVATLIATNCIFLIMINTVPPSYFLGVMWMWTGQLALLLLIAERYDVRIRLPRHGVFKTILGILAVVMTLMVFTGGYRAAFGIHGYAARAHAPWWIKKS